MFLVLSLLSLVAAPITTHTTLVPLTRPVLRLQHTSAIPPHPPEPFLPAPDHTTTPYPQQQITPPSEARPPATPTTRPPFLSREPDITTSPPTTATPYPTPHTLFRPETTAQPPNHCHTLPPPQSNNTYFHFPVHIYPFIHAPLTKNKTRARSTHSRRTHIHQLSAPASHKICMALLLLLNPPHTSDTPKRANARTHSTNGNPPLTRTMFQKPSPASDDTNPRPSPESHSSPPLKVPRTHIFDNAHSSSPPQAQSPARSISRLRDPPLRITTSRPSNAPPPTPNPTTPATPNRPPHTAPATGQPP